MGKHGDVRRVLLTGASGVLGRELVEQFVREPDVELTCLVHRTPVLDRRVRTVRGDISRRRLGLDDRGYRELVGSVDHVVNAAALVAFNGSDSSLQAINVKGAEHTTRAALDAGAVMFHVSTAYVDAQGDGPVGDVGARYAQSKRDAEAFVRASGVPHAVIRPSIILGHSVTGQIADFQGLYQMVGKFLHGRLPLVPFGPEARLDVVPVDIVAAAVVAAVRAEAFGTELWVTQGAGALPLERLVRLVMEIAASHGYDVGPPQLFAADEVDRALAQVSDDEVRRQILRAIAYFGAYINTECVLPSSTAELAVLGVPPMPSAWHVARTSLRWWADRQATPAGNAPGGGRPGAVVQLPREPVAVVAKDAAS